MMNNKCHKHRVSNLKHVQYYIQPLGEECAFYVDTAEAGSGDLNVRILDDQGKEVDLIQDELPDGLF